MRRTTAAALAATLLLAPAEADDLSALREEYLKSSGAAARVLDDVYRLTLRQLEKQRAEQGDYEGALRVREKLDQIEKRTLSAAVVPKTNVRELLAARGRTMNGANYEGSRQAIAMKKSGSVAMWEVIGLTSGGYDVFVTYSVGLPAIDPTGDKPTVNACGGVLSFGEVTGLGQGSAPLVRKVGTTGSWENFVRVRLGRIDFKSASATVKLAVDSAEAGGCAMLRMVELVPVGGPAAKAADAPAGQMSLADLRARHRDSVQGLVGSMKQRYREEFEQLEQQMIKSGDTAGAAAVAKERERLFPAKPEDEPL